MKQEIITAGKRLAALGLVCGHSGNISRRLADGTVLITASGLRKGEMAEADILHIDAEGNLLAAAPAGRRPSTETGLHLALFAVCPQITAIVHAHPPYATALATVGQALDWQLLEESRLFLGPVPRLPQLAAGSAELATAAAREAKEAGALLLAGHGAIAWGETLEQAVCRMEILEHTARVMLYTQIFQGPA